MRKNDENGGFGCKKQNGKTRKSLRRNRLRIFAGRIMQKTARRVCKKKADEPNEVTVAEFPQIQIPDVALSGGLVGRSIVRLGPIAGP